MANFLNCPHALVASQKTANPKVNSSPQSLVLFGCLYVFMQPITYLTGTQYYIHAKKRAKKGMSINLSATKPGFLYHDFNMQFSDHRRIDDVYEKYF